MAPTGVSPALPPGSSREGRARQRTPARTPVGAAVRLYLAPSSFASDAVLLSVFEKDAAFDAIELDDWLSQEHLAAWFADISPELRLPTMVIGERAVFGHAEIAAALDDAFPGPRLAPDETEARGRVLAWLNLAEQLPDERLRIALSRGVRRILVRKDLARRARRLKRLSAEHPRHDAIWAAQTARLKTLCATDASSDGLQESMRNLDAVVARFDSHIAGRAFIEGAAWTIADAAWTALLARLRFLGLDEIAQSARRPNADSYFVAMKARPSFKRAQIKERARLCDDVVSYIRGMAVERRYSERLEGADNGQST